METILYFLPFIISIFLLMFFKKNIVWWEYIILIIPSILFTLTVKEIMIISKTEDIEYLGGYVTKIRHYDEWDEWIERTCTRMVAVGEDDEGNTIYEEEEYDCSYRQYHAEYWTYVSNISSYERSLNEKTFNLIKNRFKSKMVFVDMHRNYYRIDGDAQDYFWNNQKETIYTITEPHGYENKIKASNSIFKFEEISKKEAKEFNLYDYPDIYSLDQNPLLNNTNIQFNNNDINELKYINGFYGKEKQFRIFVLIFDSNKTIETAYKQQSYWQGGNKNELIVCFSLNPDKTVNWCYSFSWEDDRKMAIKTMERYRNNEILNISEYSEWLINNLKYWKRKEFADFKYIKISLTKEQIIALFVLTFILNIGISIFIISNEYENKIKK